MEKRIDNDDVFIQNPNIKHLEQDFLYHFALGTKTHDFKAMFSDVQFVCMAGSRSRIKRFAEEMLAELHIQLPAGQGLVNIASGTDRFVMYKVGPVLAVSHGMGIPSISIMLHETAKLLHHAGCKDVTFFRIGTSGGIGLKPGSVVISDSCCDGMFRSYHEMIIMGKAVQRPVNLDSDLSNELLNLAKTFPHFETVKGKTLCTNDFYEEQGRIDGAICEHTVEEKMDFLKTAKEHGVVNIEMESLAFASFCNYLKIRGCVMAVVLVDRTITDQVTEPPDILHAWELRLVQILSAFVLGRLKPLLRKDSMIKVDCALCSRLRRSSESIEGRSNLYSS